VLADVSPTSIQSLVLNTADGQTINQTTTVTLTLPNFAAMQTQFAQSGLVSSLNSSIRSTQLLSH
jgi:predicted rRNA methylase YqxC with S4 and FtsJ domains